MLIKHFALGIDEILIEENVECMKITKWDETGAHTLIKYMIKNT